MTRAQKPAAWLFENQHNDAELIFNAEGWYAKRLLELGWRATPLAPPDEAKRLRIALERIKRAIEDGRVCDDVPWFSSCETLFDFVATALEPAAALGDLFADDADPQRIGCDFNGCRDFACPQCRPGYRPAIAALLPVLRAIVASGTVERMDLAHIERGVAALALDAS